MFVFYYAQLRGKRTFFSPLQVRINMINQRNLDYIKKLNVIKAQKTILTVINTSAFGTSTWNQEISRKYISLQ